MQPARLENSHWRQRRRGECAPRDPRAWPARLAAILLILVGAREWKERRQVEKGVEGQIPTTALNAPHCRLAREAVLGGAESGWRPQQSNLEAAVRPAPLNWAWDRSVCAQRSAGIDPTRG